MDFAPEANQGKLSEDRLPNPIDVLISTDAYGVGVNLQDASVVVDYDLSWTPDTLVQRAGRVLRFWKEPRTVRFFIFTGEFHQYAQGRDASLKVEARLRTLTERGRKAEQYTEMPVLPESETAAFESLAELSSVENLGTATLEQFEEFSGVTHFLQHTTELKKNLNYFKTIPDDISSARMYDGEHDLIYVLLRHRVEYGWIVVDLKTHRERVLTEDPLLDLLACSQDAEVAAVPRDRIEILAQKCRMAWAQKRQIEDPDEVERICALYLVGKESSDDPEHLLWSAVATQPSAPRA